MEIVKYIKVIVFGVSTKNVHAKMCIVEIVGRNKIAGSAFGGFSRTKPPQTPPMIMSIVSWQVAI